MKPSMIIRKFIGVAIVDNVEIVYVYPGSDLQLVKSHPV